MAKEPARRYSTAAEFSDDLDRFLAGEPIRARPVGLIEWAWRWSRRNPLIASLGAAVLMLLITVAIGSSIAAIRAWTAISANRLDQARQYAEQLKPLDAPAAALVIGETYERENLIDKAMESYDSGLPTDLAWADRRHVLLLAAAAQARIRKANDLTTPKTQAADLRTTAVDQLRAAVRLAPQHSRAWFWRGLLARQLKMFLDAAADPELQTSFRREAIELLDLAIPAAPAEGRPDLVRLQRELNER